jgi:type II secretory pathway component PulC
MFGTRKEASKVPTRGPLRTRGVKESKKPEGRLKLTGTVLDAQGNSCAFILDEKEKKQAVYRLNDYVGEAKVEKINSDSVILDRSGEKEVLNLSFERGPALKRAVQTRRASVRRPARRRPPPKRPAQEKVTIEEVEEEEVEDEGEEDID